MRHSIPAIRNYMTLSPHSIGGEQTLADARAMMLGNDIRHLPVLNEGKLVGVVTYSEVHALDVFAGVDGQEVTVWDAMTTSVYAVSPETPLDEVASEMAFHKYGCVVVMQDHDVVGIFTTVDACRALADSLRAPG
jgi:acetoin utilization protein AcuB